MNVFLSVLVSLISSEKSSVDEIKKNHIKKLTCFSIVHLTVF